MPRQCVYCGATSNLNTQMTITLSDGQKHTVDICDAHAEEATIKSARDAFQDKKKQIDDLLAKAKELGIDITQTASGLTVASQKPQEKQEKTAAPTIPTINRSDEDVIPTSKLDHSRGMMSVGGQTDAGQVSSFSSHDLNSLTDKLPEEARLGLAKMTVVEGRAGQPLVIPKQRVDGTGTTNITVTKKETDQQLQARFKHMSALSMQDGGPVPNFARQGYQNTTTKCTFCKDGYVRTRNGNELCPKCGGSSILPKY